MGPRLVIFLVLSLPRHTGPLASNHPAKVLVAGYLLSVQDLWVCLWCRHMPFCRVAWQRNLILLAVYTPLRSSKFRKFFLYCIVKFCQREILNFVADADLVCFPSTVLRNVCTETAMLQTVRNDCKSVQKDLQVPFPDCQNMSLL